MEVRCLFRDKVPGDTLWGAIVSNDFLSVSLMKKLMNSKFCEETSCTNTKLVPWSIHINVVLPQNAAGRPRTPPQSGPKLLQDAQPSPTMKQKLPHMP